MPSTPELLLRFLDAFVASHTARGDEIRTTYSAANAAREELERVGFARDDLQRLGRAMLLRPAVHEYLDALHLANMPGRNYPQANSPTGRRIAAALAELKEVSDWVSIDERTSDTPARP